MHRPIARLVLLIAVALVARTGAAQTVDPGRGASDDFFGVSKIHTFELTISAEDFARMPPPNGRGGRGLGGGRVPGLPDDESGYPKVPAALRFDGKDWGRLTIRYKGNSSYRGAPGALKRSLKLDFDEPDKTHVFFGMPKLNLNNNAFDPSQMREALAYDVFRRAGVPAPRTAFAKVYITVPGQYERQYAGLFTAIEQIDQTFFSSRWGQRVGMLVKPEGLRGMPDLGEDWKRYESAYASKVTATPADAARFIAFVQFVGHATDDEFAKQIGDYVDVEEFLRFLAAEVVIVNTDSPLGMNHNYWITVQPKTHKVVWLPWDMNMAFGGFRSGDIDLSLRSPSAPGMIPLADRLLASPQWQRRYNEILRELMTSNVTPARMSAEITGMAGVIREAVAADQTTTLATFERSVVEEPSTDSDANSGGGGFFGSGRGGPPLRQFVDERIESVVEQLAGKRVGTPGRGRGFAPPPPRF
jgi:spore coat protein CotH